MSTRSFQVTAFAALLVAALGCAFSPVNKPNPALYQSAFAREQVVRGTSSDVLDAVRSALEAMGYEIQSITPELGQVLTKSQQVAIPQLCDCGTWNLDPVRGTADSLFKVTVASHVSDSATVAIEHLCGTQFAGQNLYGATTRREAYQCASRGIVEANFWSTLDKIVKARSAASQS